MQNPSVLIDNAADSRIGCAYHIPPALDRSHHYHRKMLMWRRRIAKPGVVRNRCKQSRAFSTEGSSELWKYDFKTDVNCKGIPVHSKQSVPGAGRKIRYLGNNFARKKEK